MKIQENILKIIEQADTNGNELRLTGTLDRKTYLDVNKFIELCGGKWNKKTKSHVFEINAIDRIDQILLTGEIDVPKDEFNYFPTPDAVIDIMLDSINASPYILSDTSILEPSAGRGAIASRLDGFGANITCVEKMDTNYAALCEIPFPIKPIHGDFLEVASALPLFDYVVMNPPFTKQQDIKHVTAAYNLLKKGGKLVSIMSASVLFRDNKITKDFRDLVYPECSKSPVVQGGDE